MFIIYSLSSFGWNLFGWHSLGQPIDYFLSTLCRPNDCQPNDCRPNDCRPNELWPNESQPNEHAPLFIVLN